MKGYKVVKKRVTLKFTVDVCDGYDGFEFMKEDFMTELNCCVNSPDEDSFEMVVEDVCACYKDACKLMWDKLDDDEKQAVKEIPYFDAEVFKEITGIDVNEEDNNG